MITSALDYLIGTKSQRFLHKHQKVLDIINSLEDSYSKLTGEEIRKLIADIREDIKAKNNASFHLPQVFALVREAAKRTIGHRHYDVQMMGGMALYYGYIAEMGTGEGKTLVATAAVVLRALQGPVHVVTVNEYLAEEGCKLMGKVYNYLGLSCGYITQNTDAQEEIYIFSTKSIVYTSNNQIVFHYLRHLLRKETHITYNGKKVPIIFPTYCAIVDEMDYILIDESRTPFIISKKADTDFTTLYENINKIILQLINEVHYVIVFKSHNVFLTDEGTAFLEKILQENNLISSSLYMSENNTILHVIRQLLKAHHIYRKDIEYTVENGKVIIIDESTGRLSIGRRFSGGLHQALEAKEGVSILEENETLLSITYTAFFQKYEVLCGMTGTAFTEKEEFWETYGLEIITIPPNRPKIRVDHEIRLYKNRELQLKALINLIETNHNRGQPILVVTTNVQESEVISYMLQKKSIAHQLLNAKNNKKEAEFIANAGTLRAVTIATNMAGRGTDIKLGGNYDFQIEQMLLLSSEENENINGNEDKSLMEEEQLGDIKFGEMNLTLSQKKKIKTILEAFEPEKRKVEAVGGLCVITFGIPDSEKIPIQARGRAGRQGDPGESHAFYSLEDDVVKTSLQDSWNRLIFSQIYGEQDEYVSGSPVESFIRKSWSAIKAQHFRSRKELNKYETIRNQQRDDYFIYREAILQTDKLEDYIRQCFEVFMKEDYEAYKLDYLRDKFGTSFATKEQLRELFTNKMEQVDFSEFREQTLQIIDHIWSLNINEVHSIQFGSNLQAYAQKDPYYEFKMEASNVFNKSVKTLRFNILESFFNYEENNFHSNTLDEINIKMQDMYEKISKRVEDMIAFEKGENMRKDNMTEDDDKYQTESRLSEEDLERLYRMAHAKDITEQRNMMKNLPDYLKVNKEEE